jgi:hypothetical protein
MDSKDGLLVLSNGITFPYNPYIFNRDSFIAYSIQRGEWKVTEELLLRLIPFLNVTEVNFVGKSQVVVKSAENFHVEVKFTDKKITYVRVIQFFKCQTQGFELVPYKTMRGYLPCDELPISVEEKVSIPLSQLEMELGALVSVMLTKFYGFKFEMGLD